MNKTDELGRCGAWPLYTGGLSFGLINPELAADLQGRWEAQAHGCLSHDIGRVIFWDDDEPPPDPDDGEQLTKAA